MKIKDLRYAKINSANPLYLTINKTNGYIEGSNGNKYLILVCTNEIKDILKDYEELQAKIRWYQIRTISNSSDNYD